MKRVIRGLALVTVFFGMGTALAGVTTGTMRVIVRDKGGGPLRGAQVTAETAESLAKRTGITDAAGEAVLLGLDPSARYVVTTLFSGYESARNESVLVRTGETTTLRVEIAPGMAESVTVTARSPLVDMTTAMAGQEITLELTESLPTGRSYQSYLQLVPGVGPDALGDPAWTNPASRSGLNYSQNGCTNGCSRDNYYYVEGINVTGISEGQHSASFNTEAIQEQKVITGGIPAEYKGAPGLISNVVTKSGGNDFSGSVNYFFQGDNLQASSSKPTFVADDFSTYDTAFTLGGPIRRDKAWFFVSYRKFNRKDDVHLAGTGDFLRTVEQDEDQYYAKLTWQSTNKDRLSGTLLGDPRDTTGSANPFLANNRLNVAEQGGPRFIVDYQRVFGSGVLELAFGRHQAESSSRPVLWEPRNSIVFDRSQSYGLTDEQLGGSGWFGGYENTNEFINGSTEWLVDSSWGHHTIKGGLAYEEHAIFDEDRRVENAGYTSLNTDLPAFIGMPVTPDYLLNGDNTAELPSFAYWPAHFDGLIGAIDGLPNRDGFYALLDLDSDGAITMAEAGSAIVFDSTTGNPHGAINYERTLQADPYVTEVRSEGLSLYLQDTLQRGKWTFNTGVRAERWEHFDSSGRRMFTFDWEYAPRLSAIYDLRGDGKRKLSGFYGRYYDPARDNLTSFAGTLLQPLTERQVYVNGEWITFAQRGGPTPPEAVFAPSTRTPYTDEWQLEYEMDLGRNMSLEANLVKRETRNLMEDYDLSQYAFRDDGTTAYPGPVDHPDSLFLGLDYFGFEQFPDERWVIATLAGGWRDWEGFEVIFRKRLVNRWQCIASYSYADAEGNTNADSGISAQADYFVLDPRAPNATGTLPGTIHHQVKLLGSYNWDNGIKLGATYRWNSGLIESKLYTNAIPVVAGLPGSTIDPYEYAGITGTWIEPGSVGTVENPSWGVLDIRAQYNHQFGRVGTEFFVDVFNVFNDQAPIRLIPFINGHPGFGLDFGEPTEFVPPRRFFIGARASF